MLLRRSTCECPFVAPPPRCEWLTLGVASPRTMKAVRKFPPGLTRFPQLKTRSEDASRTSAMPVIRRESAPGSLRSRLPQLGLPSAVHAPPQLPPRADRPLSVLPGVLKTRLPATVADKSPATPPASNRRSVHLRFLRQFPSLACLAPPSRIFVL